MKGSLAMLALSVVLAVGVLAPAAAQELRFSAADIAGWSERSFAGQTEYRLVDKDGVSVLQARSRGQASARYLERSVDLVTTPYLHWCWQVQSLYPGAVETTKAGDDYPARVYVVHKHGLLPWQVRSVNYVWSSTQAAGAHWPNAFTPRAHLLAVQGGAARLGDWVAEVRDVRADFRALFGEAPDAIDGIALMSDGDNTGGDATAWIAHIGFTASAEPPRCP